MKANGHKKSESEFQKEVIDLIKKKGGYVIKIHVSAYQNNQGVPDLICCYHGRFVGFELKVEGGRPSELQKFRVNQIRNAGGIAIISNSLKEIEETLDEIFRVQHSSESWK